ncbi:NDP-glycosyltransferase YjiC-like [Panonychus citri]|uniref:NDP-glycosyltransferase YjiC-like n=1 Tax=Panonychus citri TaxID=50023 RepID=UPI002307EE26|nr:NDP-glycosyltransferase YjiC-like [Panonychus citri]
MLENNQQPNSDQDRPLKVFITAMLATGHFNSCLGIGSLLKKRGHDIYFAHLPKNQSIIEQQGMKFVNLLDYSSEIVPVEDTFLANIERFNKQFEDACESSPLEQLKIGKGINKLASFFHNTTGTIVKESEVMVKLVDELKPDVCIGDYVFPTPWMEFVDVPTIHVMSVSPLDLYDGPPTGSGYSINDPLKLWKEFSVRAEEGKERIAMIAAEIFEHFGIVYMKDASPKYLGIYIYPKPLDYKELGQPKPRWIRLDSAVRLPETSDFIIPEKLANKPGKLIYLSMGTLASINPDLLNLLLEPLAKSPHRFIISTGRNGDQVKLYDNMWGDKFVNQIAILPHVDLFITHAGSNSLIEGLAAAKPLISIPVFGDQQDNAQRVVDLGLGAKINLWEFDGDKFLETIENLLADEIIQRNVALISKEFKNQTHRIKFVKPSSKLQEQKNQLINYCNFFQTENKKLYSF